MYYVPWKEPDNSIIAWYYLSLVMQILCEYKLKKKNTCVKIVKAITKSMIILINVQLYRVLE